MDYQASLSYAEAAIALDADGDGDVDETEFEAAAKGYNLMEKMVAMMEEEDLLGVGSPQVGSPSAKQQEKTDEYTELVDQLAIQLLGPDPLHKIKNELVQRIIDSLGEETDMSHTVPPSDSPNRAM